MASKASTDKAPITTKIPFLKPFDMVHLIDSNPAGPTGMAITIPIAIPKKSAFKIKINPPNLPT